MAGTTNISRSLPSRSFAHIWKQMPINRNHVLTGKPHKRSLKRVTPWTCASSQIRAWEMKTHRKECQTAHSVSYSLSAKYPLWLPFSLIFLITNDHQKHNFHFSSVHSKKKKKKKHNDSKVKKKSFSETSISLTKSTKSKMRDGSPWTMPSEHSSPRGIPVGGLPWLCPLDQWRSEAFLFQG